MKRSVCINGLWYDYGEDIPALDVHVEDIKEILKRDIDRRLFAETVNNQFTERLPASGIKNLEDLKKEIDQATISAGISQKSRDDFKEAVAKAMLVSKKNRGSIETKVGIVYFDRIVDTPADVLKRAENLWLSKFNSSFQLYDSGLLPEPPPSPLTYWEFKNIFVEKAKSVLNINNS